MQTAAFDPDLDCALCGARFPDSCRAEVHRAALERTSAMPAANEPAAPLFTLDGAPTSLEDMLKSNPELLDAGDVQDVRAMQVGDVKLLGGGAFATAVLRRVV